MNMTNKAWQVTINTSAKVNNRKSNTKMQVVKKETSTGKTDFIDFSSAVIRRHSIDGHGGGYRGL